MSEKKYKMTPIEKEFSEAIEKLNAKIKIVADAMKDLNKYCDNHNMTLDYNCDAIWLKGKKTISSEESDYLCEMIDDIDTQQLFNELENAGWNTSSMSC